MDVFSSLSTMVLVFDLQIIHMRYSLDTFIQYMLQYALYCIDGSLSSVYEPVLIKQHPEARVEVVRPVSCESVTFIHSLYTTKQWDSSLAQKAFDEQKRRITLCQQGQYFSRYFSLLAHLTQGTQAHSLFTTKEFKLLDSDYLVTSNIGGSRYIKHFFYVRDLPVHYNVGYTIQDEVATLCFACNSAHVTIETLQQGCNEFYQLAYEFFRMSMKE